MFGITNERRMLKYTTEVALLLSFIGMAMEVSKYTWTLG